jgi:hypothetical protein
MKNLFPKKLQVQKSLCETPLDTPLLKEKKNVVADNSSDAGPSFIPEKEWLGSI